MAMIIVLMLGPGTEITHRSQAELMATPVRALYGLGESGGLVIDAHGTL